MSERFTIEHQGQTFERFRRTWRDPKTHMLAPRATGHAIDARISQDEQLRLSATAQDFYDLSELHRQEFARKGRVYCGVKLEIAHRHTHCWQCRTALDGGIELSCGACGWIICWCGACGC